LPAKTNKTGSFFRVLPPRAETLYSAPFRRRCPLLCPLGSGDLHTLITHDKLRRIHHDPPPNELLFPAVTKGPELFSRLTQFVM
jgi:hypothetical protein